jgi:hypothetical protein
MFGTILGALFAAPAFSDTEVSWVIDDDRLLVVVESPARFAFARPERVFELTPLPSSKGWRPVADVEAIDLQGIDPFSESGIPVTGPGTGTESAG